MDSAEFSSNPDLSMYKGTIYSSREILPQQPKYIVQSPLTSADNHSDDYSITISKTPAEVQPTLKIKLFILLATCMGFFCMGINNTVVGTTLVHMGFLFEVNTQQMAYTLTAMSLGNIIGSILSGFIFNWFSDLMQFGVLYLGMGVLTVASPWVPSVYVYYVTFGMVHYLQGYSQCGGVAYVVALFPKHKRLTLQMANALWSFGSFTFPFMAILFLVEIPKICHCQQNNYMHTRSNSLYNNSSLVPDMNYINVEMNCVYHYQNNSILNGSEPGIKPCSTDIIGLESVRHPFHIVGFLNISTSILFFALVLVLKPRFLMQRRRNNPKALPVEEFKNDPKTKKWIKRTHFVLLFLSVLFIAFYLWYEYIFGTFLSTFAIKGLKLPVEQATLLVSLFYGSWTAGRIVALFLSIILSPTKMISINMTFTILAYTLLLFSGYNDWIVWIGVGTLGFFLASTFPTLMLWVSDYMVLSSGISSVLLTTNALTSAVGSVVVGYLTQHYTHMVLVYINLIFCIINACVFVVMVVIGVLHNRLQRNVI